MTKRYFEKLKFFKNEGKFFFLVIFQGILVIMEKEWIDVKYIF